MIQTSTMRRNGNSVGRGLRGLRKNLSNVSNGTISTAGMSDLSSSSNNYGIMPGDQSKLLAVCCSRYLFAKLLI